MVHLPDDVRDHYAGADHWRDRRADEVFGSDAVCGAVDVHRLFPRRAHAVGDRRHDERGVERGGEG